MNELQSSKVPERKSYKVKETAMTIQNIFENFGGELKEEFFEEILAGRDFKMERIVSEGHSSPENFWYDQDKNEFVLLISGGAVLEFENNELIEMKPGDYLIIPAHKKHRVAKTDSEQKTFWLALHFV